MKNLKKIGRIFYGTAIAGLGLGAIYYNEFPYMLCPPNHLAKPILAIFTYAVGTLLFLAGGGIVFQKRAGLFSLLLGSGLLLTVGCCYIPYELVNHSNFGEWENAEKELALCGGAFLIAGCFREHYEDRVTRISRKLVSLGRIFFLIPIFIFGIDHFLFTKEAATLVPSWITYHIFWTYFAGAALIGSAIALMFKIETGIIAFLMGTMIFLWFILLHVPRVVISPVADRGDEVTSAFLALAYSGIAFVIAGAAKKYNLKQMKKPLLG